MQHIVTIAYCTQCRWMFRAVWMAQELMSTFEAELDEVRLQKTTGGQFNIWADDQLIFSRKESGRFPEITELKQLVRDVIAPDKPLGHSDKPKTS